MQLLYSTLAVLLLQTVIALPNANANPAPAAVANVLEKRQASSSGMNTAALTGAFTVNGGTYDVTSQSGYAEVAGHTLSVGGADALVGGEIVTVASGGVMVTGATVALIAVTSSSSSSSSMETSSDSVASTDGGIGTAIVGGRPTASLTAATTSSHAMAPATAMPIAGAVLGGLIGLMAI